MNKEILLNRFKSLLKEANKLDTIIRTSSLSLNKIEEDLKQIYLQEDSVFDDLLKKIHESGYDEQTIISTVMTQSTITIGRLLECYNLMKLLEVEPEFESPEDKMNFLNVKNSMELRLTFFNLPKIFIYISIILMAYTLTNMTKFTEFLYFNF